jgi:glycosyltransferase involved in cell wall biosynthesis
MQREEAARWPGAGAPLSEPRWKQRRKDRERALADVAVVASSFTRQSLLEVGFTRPVVVASYGFPAQFIAARPSRPTGPFTVVAVGNHSLRKGTPWLLEAWKQAALPDARLMLIGSMQLSEDFLRPYRGLFEHIRHVPRSQLSAHYQAADLLAFPTLGDGFGLVIVEAMCAGTPVLTTRCGGGPECITDGVDGLLVPERNLDALVEALRAAHADRERLFQLGQAARRRAEAYDDVRSGEALVRHLRAVLK